MTHRLLLQWRFGLFVEVVDFHIALVPRFDVTLEGFGGGASGCRPHADVVSAGLADDVSVAAKGFKLVGTLVGRFLGGEESGHDVESLLTVLEGGGFGDNFFVGGGGRLFGSIGFGICVGTASVGAVTIAVAVGSETQGGHYIVENIAEEVVVHQFFLHFVFLL